MCVDFGLGMTDAVTRMHLLSPDKHGEFKSGLRWEKPRAVELPKHMKRMSLEDKLKYAYDEGDKGKVRADQVGGGASDVFMVGAGYRLMRNALKKRRERKASQGASNKAALEQKQKEAEEARARERRARARERKTLAEGMQKGSRAGSSDGGSRPSTEARARASNDAFREQQKDARYAGVHKGEHVNASFYDHNKVMDIISDKFSSRAGGARHYFRRFDVDNDGSVSRDEFREGLRQLGIGLSESQISAVADSVDVNQDGSVNYYEFANGVHMHSSTLERNNRAQRKARKKPSADAEHTSLPNVTHQIRPVIKGPTTPKRPLPNLRHKVGGVLDALPELKSARGGGAPAESDVLVVGQGDEGYASSEDEDAEARRRERREARKRAERDANASREDTAEELPEARGEGTTDDWLMCKLWAELEVRLDAPERKEIWREHDQGALQRMEARLDGHENARQAESEALAGALGAIKVGERERKRLKGLLAAQQVKVSPSKGLVELLREQAELSAGRLKGFHVNSLQVHAQQGGKQRKASFWEWVRRYKLAESRAGSRAGTSSGTSRPSTWGSSRMGSSDARRASRDDLPGSSWQRVKGGERRGRDVHRSSAADGQGTQRQALVSIDENAPLYANEKQRLARIGFEDRASIAREDKERRQRRQEANIARKREENEAWMEHVEQQEFKGQRVAAKPSQRRIQGLGEQREAVRGSKKSSFVYGKDAEGARLITSPIKGIHVSDRRLHDVHDPFGEAPVHNFDKSDLNLPADDIGRKRRDYRRQLEVKQSSKRCDFSGVVF